MKASLSRRLWLASALCAAAFCLLILLLYTVDVQAIGPLGSSVGLATLNGTLRDAIGTSQALYTVSEAVGLLSFLSAAFFAAMGLLQLIRRKSFWKVDADLRLLGLLYGAVVLCYVFFELVVINRRPVLEEGILAASFPSSHTMLVCTLMGGAVYEILTRVSKLPLRIALTALCGLVATVTVAARLLSGVHWVTDILGGLLLSAALSLAFAALCKGCVREPFAKASL